MLSRSVEDYIRIRRAAGFKFEAQAGLLRSFAAYAVAKDEHYVRANSAIEWAGLAAKVPQRAHRLWTVIRFARHARGDDPQHEVPPPVFGGERWPRRTPYILSPDEIARLLQAARRFGRHPLLGETYSTLFGLPQGAGLPRISPHALRHTFAVRALLTCPDGRERIARHMVALSTYLGHVDAAATYWYLQATPELLRDIASCCERHVESAS